MSGSIPRSMAAWSVAIGGILFLSGCVTPDERSETTGVVYENTDVGSVDDFDEPLAPYGDWIVVGSYGHCWRPTHVDADWRPYCDGYWERCDAGWFWQSNEPWGWATYHYGRWDFEPEFGWFWVPETHWAPSWVEWRSGGGYVGWAPLPPSARLSVGVEVREPERRYVFVPERRFAEPIRRNNVVVNNPTIIHQTVNITRIRQVNQTVINEGPHVDVIERATGHKVRSIPTAQLRREQEAHVPVHARPAVRPPAATAAPATRVPARPRVVPAPATPNGNRGNPDAHESDKTRASPPPPPAVVVPPSRSPHTNKPEVHPSPPAPPNKTPPNMKAKAPRKKSPRQEERREDDKDKSSDQSSSDHQPEHPGE